MRQLGLGLFFLSGATALVYEVLWTRRLTLTFGHTVLAVSTVVTAYMLGLALGSRSGGRWADRVAARGAAPGSFLAAYGMLEVAIGIWAACSPWFLAGVEQAYFRATAANWSWPALQFLCWTGSLLVLTPPTLLMGATLPVLSRLLVRPQGHLNRVFSSLYAVNTVGAALGAALAGWWMLPSRGFLGSILLTALVNVSVGVLAWLAARRWNEPSAAPNPSQPAPFRASSLGLAMGLAGLAAMIFQLAWTRGLALILGSSTYGLATTLAVFLAGLGLGAALVGLRTRPAGAGHLALVLGLTGLAGALSLLVLGYLPQLATQLMHYSSPSVGGIVGPVAILSALVILPPTVLMGIALPLASALAVNDPERIGSRLSFIYAANTVGCIVGAALGGFVAIPTLGLQTTLKLASCLYVVAACLVVPPSWLRWVGALALNAVLVICYLLPSWNLAWMAAGAGIYSRGSLARETTPAFYRDGLSCTVSVEIQGPRQVALRVNGKVDASLNSDDMQTMLLLGYVPALLCQNPRRAAVIGLGSGFTLHALASTPSLETIDCAEIEPAVVEAGRYFAGYNGHVLRDRRVKIHATDGRAFLQGGLAAMDIIVSEPSNVWIAGVANLYTVEFYQSCRQRLAPGGVMCQWYHVYSSSPEELQTVLATFYSVFPHGSVWQSSESDILLIGSQTPLPLSLDRLRSLWDSSDVVRRDFCSIGLYRPELLLGHYLVGREKLTFPQAARNTDDRPLLEYSAPLSYYRAGDSTGKCMGVLLKARGPAPEMPLGVPPTPSLWLAAAHAWPILKRPDDLASIRKQVEDQPGFSLVEAVAAQGEPGPRAERLYRQALEEQPDDPLTLWLVAKMRFDDRQYEHGEPLLARLSRTPLPGCEETTLLMHAMALQTLSRIPESREQLLRATQLKTGSSKPWTALGKLEERANQNQAAASAYAQALQRNQADLEAWEGYGPALLLCGRLPEAVQANRTALLLQPQNVAILLNLAQSLLAIGDREANQVLRRVLELDPENRTARFLLYGDGQ